MAHVKLRGLDAVIGELEKVGELGTDEEAERILNAMADAAEPVMRRNAEKDVIGLRGKWTGGTKKSIGRTKMKKRRDGGRVMYLYPQGERERGKEKKSVTRNGEIGFLNEYGVPSKKMMARKWVEKTAVQAETAVEAAVVKEIDRLIGS